MAKAELNGQHSFPTANGVQVHIYKRDGQFIARGSWNRQRFGVTLGATEKDANVALRRVLAEIDDGRFQRPSAGKATQVKASAPARLGFAELCDRYLAHVGSVSGKRTQANYRDRLMHAIRFAESPAGRSRWPYVGTVDDDFAVALKTHLYTVETTRNGKPGGTRTPLSANHIRNVLETVRFMFHWADRPKIRLVPFGFENPVTRELVGDKPSKDPFRPQVLPLADRVALVKGFDCWQLGAIGLMTLLPTRPEEVAGILITDCDFDAGTIRFGTRFDGADFGKGRQQYTMPLPPDLVPVLRACAGDRLAGPLFRRRPIWELRQFPKTPVYQASDIEDELKRRLRSSKATTAQDRKTVFRELVRDMGGVTPGVLGREFRRAAGKTIRHHVQQYDLRRNVSTDMSAAGISHIALKYLTAHAVNDTMNPYVSINPFQEMEKYFAYARSLLDAIRSRGEELGCVAS